MSPSNSAEPGVHRSRHGFHPCSYETYRKLKYLRKQYWQTLYQFHHWYRWDRKQPQNRIGPEPKFCRSFADPVPWYKPVMLGGEPGCKVYPMRISDRRVLEQFEQARHPSSEPVAAWSECQLEVIEELYQEVWKHSNE